MNYIFVLTLGVIILNFIVILTYFAKNTLVLPKHEYLGVDIWYIFYPSFFYQVYWWSIYFNLI